MLFNVVKKSFFWRIEAKAASSASGKACAIEAYMAWLHSPNGDYPDVLKPAYIDYNTTVPSSGPVERLFSLGKRVMSPLRSLQSDKTLELNVMLAFARS